MPIIAAEIERETKREEKSEATSPPENRGLKFDREKERDASPSAFFLASPPEEVRPTGALKWTGEIEKPRGVVIGLEIYLVERKVCVGEVLF